MADSERECFIDMGHFLVISTSIDGNTEVTRANQLSCWTA